MNRYISILRGINVGGHKKILMADLKKLYTNLGFENVVSYIQSGNVIFDSSINTSDDLKQMIQEIITSNYSFEVPVIIRTVKDLETVIKEDPFIEIDKTENGSKLHVAFLSETPEVQALQNLIDFIKESEECVLIDNHLYIWYPNGAGRSKLTTQVIERKLDVQATLRNWKTALKMLELSKS